MGNHGTVLKCHLESVVSWLRGALIPGGRAVRCPAGRGWSDAPVQKASSGAGARPAEQGLGCVSAPV